MNRKKLLYIMGIDWNWIYQRPQIIAEMLSQDYEVTLIYPRSVLKRKQKKNTTVMTERILWTLPYQEKNRFIQLCSSLLNRHLFQDIDKFDFIYVGYPLYGRYIPTSYRGKVIYDCMDNHEALYPDPKRVTHLLRQEQMLVQRCDLLLATSDLLKKKMDTIAGCSKTILLRNGVHFTTLVAPNTAQYKDIYRLCYIGTIAEWFDYDLLLTSVKVLHNIEYHLIGPASTRHEHSAVYYHGVIPHEQLVDEVQDYDCLIMPFQVNEVVAFVDPVKLYEYISYGKSIISVYYPELERFSDFVYFYKSFDEYIALLQKLGETGFPPKYNEQQQKDFLGKNTWQERYKILQQKLSKEEAANEN